MTLRSKNYYSSHLNYIIKRAPYHSNLFPGVKDKVELWSCSLSRSSMALDITGVKVTQWILNNDEWAILKDDLMISLSSCSIVSVSRQLHVSCCVMILCFLSNSHINVHLFLRLRNTVNFILQIYYSSQFFIINKLLKYK